MSIRIGPSCALKPSMIIEPCNVVETRRFVDLASGWYEISKKCIAEKKFLIVTLCIDKNGKLEYVPTKSQWRNFVEATVLQLQSIGANKYNCRIDVINEPMKYISKEKYGEYINITYSQVNKRFLVGAGCDELGYMDMYQYISSHCTFDTLVIHIQGACDNEENTSRLTNQALNLAIFYKRSIDCNEANYFSINTDSGYKGLLMNLKYAEKIGCANFPMVFMNLDKSAFAVNTDRWERLSFFVNGNLHSPYWNDYEEGGETKDGFKKIIEDKAPIPNIFIPIERNDGMIIKTIGHKPTDVKSGYGCLLLNETLNFLDYLDDDYVNFEYTDKTKSALEKWQTDIKPLYNNSVDGRCGRMTWRYFKKEVKKIDIEAYKDLCDDLEIIMSPYNIKGDT